MKKFLPLLICALVGFMGCKRVNPAINGQWNVTALEKDGIQQQLCLSFINFEAKGVYVKVNGDTGVNVFSGAVEMVDNKFLADDFAVTKMMGDPVAMDFEDLFLQTLSHATEYYLKDDVLIINAPDEGLKLTLEKPKN